MKSPKPFIRREIATLKEAVTDLVSACGGQERSAAMTRVSPSQMQRYTAPDQSEYQMPVDVALALEMSSGNPIVTQFMAAQTGHVLISTKPDDETPLSQDIATVGRDTAKLFEEWALAMRDGKISKQEAAGIEKRALDGINALASVIAEVRLIRRGAEDDA